LTSLSKPNRIREAEPALRGSFCTVPAQPFHQGFHSDTLLRLVWCAEGSECDRRLCISNVFAPSANATHLWLPCCTYLVRLGLRAELNPKDKSIQMPVFKPRNRLVNFRLSEEEFEKLRASCSLYGARSLSDFARAAVMRSVASGHSGDPVDSQPTHFTVAAAPMANKVNDLEYRVVELTRLVEALRRDSVPSPVLVPVSVSVE
jgi:hypothetical protein